MSRKSSVRRAAAPPVIEPPVIEPPVIEPPVIEPPVIELVEIPATHEVPGTDHQVPDEGSSSARL